MGTSVNYLGTIDDLLRYKENDRYSKRDRLARSLRAKGQLRNAKGQFTTQEKQFAEQIVANSGVKALPPYTPSITDVNNYLHSAQQSPLNRLISSSTGQTQALVRTTATQPVLNTTQALTKSGGANISKSTSGLIQNIPISKVNEYAYTGGHPELYRFVTDKNTSPRLIDELVRCADGVYRPRSEILKTSGGVWVSAPNGSKYLGDATKTATANTVKATKVAVQNTGQNTASTIQAAKVVAQNTKTNAANTIQATKAAAQNTKTNAANTIRSKITTFGKKARDFFTGKDNVAWKAIRRHPVAATVGAVVGVVLGIGIINSVSENKRRKDFNSLHPVTSINPQQQYDIDIYNPFNYNM